jgi:hypothetical protein
MPKEYSREEFWKLYEKLPQELQEAIFSVENAKHIKEICKRNEIEAKTSEIAKYAGDVLLGIFPPEDFKEYLEQELGIETAKRVSHEINRFIFFPVKQALAELYREPTEAGAAPARPTETKPGTKTPSAPEKEDVYREPVE